MRSTAGQRIKELRETKGLSQKEFAQMIGISPTHISKVEAKKDKPSDRVLRLISLKFQVSFEWLLTGQEPMFVETLAADQAAGDELKVDSGIGQRMKELRQRLDMNQDDFVSSIGISRSHLSNIENGNDNPSKTLLILISLLYGVSFEWLLNGRKTMFEGVPEVDNNISPATNIGERLRLIRDKFSLTPAMIAHFINCAVCNITAEDVRSYETETKEPPELFLYCMSYMFSTDFQWLKFGRAAPNQPEGVSLTD